MCVEFVSFCEERVISFGLFFKYANNNPAQNVQKSSNHVISAVSINMSLRHVYVHYISFMDVF